MVLSHSTPCSAALGSVAPQKADSVHTLFNQIAGKRQFSPVTDVTHPSDNHHGMPRVSCLKVFFMRWTMSAIATGTRVTLKNILFLTDFSEPSEVAIPFAIAIAREYGAKVYALYVLTPVPLAYATPQSTAAVIEGFEEDAQAEMQRVDSQLVGVPHEALIVRGESVWSSVDKILSDREMDLVILGTHGRTGAMKLLLGSVAEEIFRRASVPVLTIGPSVRKAAHSGGRFYRVLFPTDFTPEAQGAAPYAVSMAQENQARLLLLHVMRDPALKGTDKAGQDSVANVMHQLYELVPQAAELWCRPEATVRFGNPSERILEVAVQHDADLIVLGVRDAAGRLGAATHLERTTAHRVVAHAACPVLTVRG
jgi:nucleotide-binding universal stress UspA family protein